MQILAGSPLYKKFQMWTWCKLCTGCPQYMVLCDMCCLGGCKGLCAWSNACMWSLEIVPNGVWWHWKNRCSLLLLITQAMTLLICASHCYIHLPSRPALNCPNVSSYHSGSRPGYPDPLAARAIEPKQPFPPLDRGGQSGSHPALVTCLFQNLW